MSEVIRYGEVTQFKWQGDTLEMTSEKVHDYTHSKPSTRSVRKVLVDKKRDVTTEVLKLLDKIDDDTVTNVAFSVDKKTDGKKYRIDVSWLTK